MNISRKHRGVLRAIFRRPVSGGIRWKDVESLFQTLGADIEEREGSRIAVIFPGQVPAIFHRPHPSPMTDKGAVKVIREWLLRMGYRPEEESDGDDGA